MDTESLLRECRAETLIGPLNFETEVGKEQFKKQLRFLTPNSGLLRRRQQTILDIRHSLDEKAESTLEDMFQEVKRIEPDLKGFFDRSAVESNSYEQLLFSGWAPLQVLNTIPFLLLCLSIFKQYLVPLMAVFTPLFMMIAPYFVVTYWYNLEISPQQYINLVMGMFGLQNISLQNPRTLLQAGITMFSVGQSIYQPIQNALHLQTIHGQLVQKGQAVQKLIQINNQLERFFSSKYALHNPVSEMSESDLHRTFAAFWDHPYRLRMALQYIGDCEVIYRVAKEPRLTAVTLVGSKSPVLKIHKGYDPFLKTSIPFDLSLQASHHAILTGPNRGGKSSVLRSVLLDVVFAQTFGMAFVESMTLRPFDWIATGLRLEDRPGALSMFESEVEFSIQILQRAKHAPDQVGFVLFDELFHSTNPPDGARTADIFLQRLWQQPNVGSFISTHVFDLAKKAHSKIQKLCVPAHKKEDGSLHFTYTLQKGICEVSSVDEILKEKGLFSV
jgi:hypothetical protein